MRILQVFKDYYPPTRGGIEQHIHEIVRSNTQFLRQAGFGGHAVESAYDVLPNGLRVDKFMRSLCREALRSAELGDGDPPPDPFDPAEVEAFMGWLSAPAGGPRARPLSCYLLEVHRANPYLQSAFRLTSGPEVDA